MSNLINGECNEEQYPSPDQFDKKEEVPGLNGYEQMKRFEKELNDKKLKLIDGQKQQLEINQQMDKDYSEERKKSSIKLKLPEGLTQEEIDGIKREFMEAMKDNTGKILMIKTNGEPTFTKLTEK